MEKTKIQERIIVNIEISKIKSPKYRGRINFDKEKIEELKDSITKFGLIHPIKVKTVKGGFEIVAGERRFLAHKELKLKKISCEIISEKEIDLEMIKLHENTKREDLSDIEEAYFLDKIKNMTKKRVRDIAKLVGKSESYVTQKLMILKYPDYLFNAISEGLITFSAARELARITDPIILNDYTKHAITSGITPRIAKQWADDWIAMQETNNESVEGKNIQGYNETKQEIKFPCMICGEHYFVNETSMIRICSNDMKIIKEHLSMEK